jgi:hypothetical protein
VKIHPTAWGNPRVWMALPLIVLLLPVAIVYPLAEWLHCSASGRLLGWAYRLDRWASKKLSDPLLRWVKEGERRHG